MGDLDAELALASLLPPHFGREEQRGLCDLSITYNCWFYFESEISSLVTEQPNPPPKKKKVKHATENGTKETKTTASAVIGTASPSVTVAPSLPGIGTAPTLLPTLQTPPVMTPFLHRVGTLGGVPMMPPPVPPPIFVPTQAIRQTMLPMPMPNFFMPHQLRQPPRPSATIESGPKIYSAEVASTNPTAGCGAPITFALASDIEAMEKKNEHSHPPTRHRDPKTNKPKKYLRAGGGQVWEDPSLAEWDKNDFRIFCGDLGNEVSDELLAKAFRKYPSFRKAKVVRDSRSNKSKGYGFVSFGESDDYVRAMREMDGKYVGNRPIKLRKSNWKDRNFEVVKKKQKQKAKLGLWS
ncbi:unnamed protein product [Cylicocyclus nassatus]|uniref:RNA-binding protein 42 n=1 Tax=Cylicocyclus nassatus TaxID=53992 RepID=A0AA36M589_CYLNA|nr:unnamed protein product [Cylicocyclus nassatus]